MHRIKITLTLVPSATSHGTSLILNNRRIVSLPFIARLLHPPVPTHPPLLYSFLTFNLAQSLLSRYTKNDDSLIHGRCFIFKYHVLGRNQFRFEPRLFGEDQIPQQDEDCGRDGEPYRMAGVEGEREGGEHARSNYDAGLDAQLLC